MLNRLIMPELKNEVPSEAELHAYFLEHCPWMAKPYELEFVSQPNIVEAQTRFGCREFRVKVGEVIWEALNQLNLLDRSHKFWTNTNRRPTIYKLNDFSLMRLDEDMKDQSALWTLAALDTFHGSNDFGTEYWQQLWNLRELDIHWPVRAGLWHQMMLGYGGGLLANLIIEMNAQSAASPILAEMCRASAPQIKTWANEIVNLIQANSP